MLLLLPYRTVEHDFFSGIPVFCSLGKYTGKRFSLNTLPYINQGNEEIISLVLKV